MRMSIRRALIGTSTSAVIAACLVGTVPAADAEVSAQDAPVVAPIETLGPIATAQPTGAIVAPPLPAQVAALPSGSVLAGADVRIYSRELKDVASVPVRLIDLVATAGDPNPNAVWTGALANGWGRISTRLTGGRTYAVEAKGPAGWVSIGAIAAHTPRDAGGPQTTVGSLSVSQVLGTASWGWDSRALVGPNGGLTASLGYVPGEALPPDIPTVHGLPAGWRLGVQTGSPWMGIVTGTRLARPAQAPEGVSVTSVTDGSAHLTVPYDPEMAGQLDGFSVRVQRADGTWGDAVESAAGASDGIDVPLPEGTRAIQVGAIADGQVLWGTPVTPEGSTVATPRRALPADAVPRQALPAAVRVVGWDGSVLVFQRNALGSYEQRTGTGAPGYENVLASRPDGSWTFTDMRGVVTTFTGGRVSSVTDDGKTLAKVSWDSRGRVTSASNETGRSIDFVYAGSGTCASQGWTAYGFAAVPSGMLCQVRYPGDTVTDIGYASGMASGPQIALVKDPGNRGTAIGWDTAGRLVSTRSALLSRTATVDSSVRAALATLLDRVEYDTQGRAGRLISGPARVGGTPMVRTVAFPVINDSVLRRYVADPITANAVSTSVGLAPGQGADVRLTSSLDPVNWRVMESRDASNLTTRLNTDPRTGAVTSTRSAQGLVTKVQTNELGLPVSQEGPFVGSGGLVTNTSYDTAVVRGRDESIHGWRVTVRAHGQSSSTFWPARSSNGMSASWTGVGADWASIASAVWTPSSGESDKVTGKALPGTATSAWAFRVTAVGGARVQFTVAGLPCQPDQTGVCTMTSLPIGPKAVMMRVDRAPSSGWFDVQVAPVTVSASGTQSIGAFATVPMTDLAPGFNNATRAAVNDTFAGSEARPATVQAYADPASGRPSQIDYVGGLTERFRYETDGWGRLLARTTPGGKQVLTSYWPLTGTVTTPALCGAASVPSQGLVRSVTRQDGSVITYYHDIQGRLVASETRDDKGAVLETGCSTFRADDSQESSRVF
ncbi:MAG: hypothetical protein ACR2KE_03440, partial [Candidatus Nanopelagicales bacterium]